MNEQIKIRSKLIEEVRKHPILFKYSIKNNKTINEKKDRVWLEVSRNVGIPTKMCKIKWRHIRYSYRTGRAVFKNEDLSFLHDCTEEKNLNVETPDPLSQKSSSTRTYMGKKNRGQSSKQDDKYTISREAIETIIKTRNMEEEDSVSNSSLDHQRVEQVVSTLLPMMNTKKIQDQLPGFANIKPIVTSINAKDVACDKSTVLPLLDIINFDDNNELRQVISNISEDLPSMRASAVPNSNKSNLNVNEEISDNTQLSNKMDVEVEKNDMTSYFRVISNYISSSFPKKKQLEIRYKICSLLRTMELEDLESKN